jgi:hypothetical protein
VTRDRQSDRPAIRVRIDTDMPARDALPGLDWWRDAITREGHGVNRDMSRRREPPVVFEPEEILILSRAYEQACSILAEWRFLGPERRYEIACVIIAHARRGLFDPHRLAVKAIVKVC